MLLIAFIFHFSSLEAQEKPTPESEAGVTTVTAQEIINLMQTLPQLIVIDSRITSARRKGYIENSIHLSDLETNCQSLANFAPQKDNPIVFYCGSNVCGRSLNAVRIAKSCGYTKLYWFREGFDFWRQQGFPYQKKSGL